MAVLESRPGIVAAALVPVVALLAILVPTAVAAPTPTVLTPVAPGVPANGRAWELVSPAGVISANVGKATLITRLGRISRSGNRIAYAVNGALGIHQAGPGAGYLVAERGPNGWSNDEPLEAPQPKLWFNVIGEMGPVAFDPELRASIWIQPPGDVVVNPVNGDGLLHHGFYASRPGGGYELLADGGEGSEGGDFVGASEDLRRVIFTSKEHLLPGDAARSSGLSLYESFNSTLRLLDVGAGGAPISTCGSEANAASADATQVFFSTHPGCGLYKRVYLAEAGQTTEISASQCTLPDCGPEGDVDFLGRSPDGSTAFLGTSERLIDDDTNSDRDVYRYDIQSGDLELLYERPPASAATEVGFQVRSSGDGARAYFVARGQLIPGQGSEAGLNLYLADAAGLRFVAPIVENAVYPHIPEFVVTADGRYALFATSASLGAADSDERVDLYRYDAVTGGFAQVSAGVGGPGNGPFDVFMPPPGAAADIVARVVFTTAEPLLPQDRNEAADVYEWTPAGLGLISAGAPGMSAEYFDMTADSRTVVFATAATLLGRDRDGGDKDYYAARVGGGFPEPPLAGGDCEGVGCGPAASRDPRSAPSGEAASRLVLARLDGAARRQLLAKGWTTVLAEAPAAGRLRAVGRARLGTKRKTVATGSAAAAGAGPVQLRLELTRVARRSLAHGGKLRVRLVLRLAGQGSVATAFALGGGK
jgi:hypothetical protein